MNDGQFILVVLAIAHSYWTQKAKRRVVGWTHNVGYLMFLVFFWLYPFGHGEFTELCSNAITFCYTVVPVVFIFIFSCVITELSG